MDENPRYLINPDVSCREEAPDEGAILFNPDTDSVLVINATGLMIWRAMERPRTRQEVVAYLMDNCADAPADQVDEDVQAFLQNLQPRGFIGVVTASEA